MTELIATQLRSTDQRIVEHVVDRLRPSDDRECVTYAGSYPLLVEATLAAAARGPYAEAFFGNDGPCAIAFAARPYEGGADLNVGLYATDAWPTIAPAVLRRLLGVVRPQLARIGSVFWCEAMAGHADAAAFIGRLGGRFVASREVNGVLFDRFEWRPGASRSSSGSAAVAQETDHVSA